MPTQTPRSTYSLKDIERDIQTRADPTINIAEEESYKIAREILDQALMDVVELLPVEDSEATAPSTATGWASLTDPLARATSLTLETPPAAAALSAPQPPSQPGRPASSGTCLILPAPETKEHPIARSTRKAPEPADAPTNISTPAKEESPVGRANGAGSNSATVSSRRVTPAFTMLPSPPTRWNNDPSAGPGEHSPAVGNSSPSNYRQSLKERQIRRELIHQRLTQLKEQSKHLEEDLRQLQRVLKQCRESRDGKPIFVPDSQPSHIATPALAKVEPAFAGTPPESTRVKPEISPFGGSAGAFTPTVAKPENTWSPAVALPSELPQAAVPSTRFPAGRGSFSADEQSSQTP